MPQPQAPVDPKALAQTALAKVGITPIGSQQHISVELQLPNRLVGLVIGKGGESIQRMQNESGAKIQVAPDGSEVSGIRMCTVSGSPDQVEKAKALINVVIMNASEELSPNQVSLTGQYVDQMLIDAHRVGLIIGKGGEMIKSLSERSGCKLQMIQDGEYLTAPQKPLKIIGERDACQRAKQMVAELITARESGSGPPRFGAPSETNDVFVCEADKCGVLIGKGGATIHQLQAQSGAHIELDRGPPQSDNERVFIIRGNKQQILAAQNLMRQKLEQPFPGRGGNGGGGPPMGGPYGMGYGGPQPGFGYGGPQPGGGGGGVWPGYGQPQYPQQYPQPYGGMMGQPPPPQQTMPMPQQPQQPQPQQQQPMGGAPQPATSGVQGQPQQQQQQQPYDYNAAWAAYWQYAQAHGQQMQEAQQQQGAGPPSQTAKAATPQSQQDLQAQWAEYYRMAGAYYQQPQPQGGVPDGQGIHNSDK